MLLSLALLALAPSHADEVSVEAFAQAAPGQAFTTGLGARLEAGAPFLAVEGFGNAHGQWLGRATGGLDVLGGSDTLDLTLGLFLGTTGEWMQPRVGPQLTAGIELGLGVHVGPLGLRYRRVDGFRGPLEDRLTQDELRLGWSFTERVEVFGQYVNFTPRRDERIDGYGAGATLRF